MLECKFRQCGYQRQSLRPTHRVNLFKELLSRKSQANIAVKVQVIHKTGGVASYKMAVTLTFGRRFLLYRGNVESNVK